MNAPPLLDDLYFDWLVGLVGDSDINKFELLLKRLYTTEFVWVVPNDDNRAEDGRDCRAEFADQHDIDELDNEAWFGLGCSMLELFVGLSRRLSFETDGEPRDWFWRLIHNANLHKCKNETEIDEILNKIIWRTYEPSGLGGLFPLKKPDRDQRKVELWYQLCAHLIELEYF